MLKNKYINIFALCFSSLLASIANAEPVRVITTGDSFTTQFYKNLSPVFQQMNFSAEVVNPEFGRLGSSDTARGGITASIYSGHAKFENEAHVNYASNVMEANPDVIIYMLGFNDLFWGTSEDNANSNSNAAVRYQSYTTEIETIFNQFANYKNLNDKHPVVYIGSILPFDLARSSSNLHTNLNSGALERIQHWYNPWLRDQARRNGFNYVDLWSDIQQVDGWQEKYLTPTDGIHLSADGVNWTANQFAQAIVPEPNFMVLLSGIGMFVFWRVKSRN